MGVQMAEDWRKALRDVRKRLGLTQDRLAELAGISPDTLRGYENGRRSPRRDHLAAVLTALRLEHGERRKILEGAGFVAEPRSQLEQYAGLWHTEASALAECGRHRWPSFVTDEFARVVGANTVAQAIWGVDLDREFASPVERNLLSVASDPRFADRCLNWDEAIGTIIAVFKAHDWAPESVDTPGPYFAAVLAHFLKGDPKYVSRFLKIWQSTSPIWERKERWTYPVIWQSPGYPRMHFEALTTTASMIDGLGFNDWIPLDADTWRGLAQLAE